MEPMVAVSRASGLLRSTASEQKIRWCLVPSIPSDIALHTKAFREPLVHGHVVPGQLGAGRVEGEGFA